MDAIVAMLQHKTIKRRLLYAVDRQNVWEDTQKRPLGVHNHGTDDVVVILKPHLFASIRDYRSYFCREHGNTKFASGTNWNGEGFRPPFKRALEKAFSQPNVNKAEREVVSVQCCTDTGCLNEKAILERISR